MVGIEPTELIEVTQEEKSLLILALDVFATKYMKEQMNMLKDMQVGKSYDTEEYEQAQRFIVATGKLVEKINSRDKILC